MVAPKNYAQKEFFCSQQKFSADNLGNFYSSLSIEGNLLLFGANDYQLYAYNKNNGTLLWQYKTNRKTNKPVFVNNNIAYTDFHNTESNNQEGSGQTIQLDLSNGQLLKSLPFGYLETKPAVKNGILYGTCIYNYGCIIAYNINKDTVIWNRFIAHGYTRQPYYFDNKIMANAEGSNWVELDYNGALLDTTCAEKATFFVENIPCVKNFSAITHDGLEINGAMSEKLMGGYDNEENSILLSKKYTYIVQDEELNMLGNKLKLGRPVYLYDLFDSLPEGTGKAKLLKADDENIWLLYLNHLIQYNHKTKKVLQRTDLTQWEPHSVLLDDKNIWLISRKDGLLYGISMENK